MAALSGMRFLKFVWPSLLLLLLVLTSLSVGPAPVTLAEMFGLSDGQQAEQVRLVLVELRLPRTIMAVLTGATLAVGGAVMQSLFRNPLAEPGLVGVSAGAALGAVAAIALGVTGFWQSVLPDLSALRWPRALPGNSPVGGQAQLVCYLLALRSTPSFSA